MEYIRPSRHLFGRIVKNTPLVSLDLIIRNKKGDYLLNLRGRHPAYHKWFFFGGSIKKPLKPNEAFKHIIDREFFSLLSEDFEASKIGKLAVHQYKENTNRYVNNIKKGVQYYVLCYEFTIEQEIDLQKIKFEYKKECNEKFLSRIKKIFGIKTEPEVLDIKWFSKEEINNLLEVHDYVRDYFNNNPSTIIVTSFGATQGPTEQLLKSSSKSSNLSHLLALYQAQTKSINNYTTVIWTFPIVFVIALGNVFKNFNENDLIIIISAIFAFVLLHAFKKHTYIHEALKDSLEKIEDRIKHESEYIRDLMPDWSFVNSHRKSHEWIRGFIIFFTYFYALICLLTLIFNHLQTYCGLLGKVLKYILRPF